VFQAHAIVVYCGVYHAVHRFAGYIIFLPPLIYCFVDVPVFAATVLHLSDKYLFQNSGRVDVSLKILFNKYACQLDITDSHSDSVCSKTVIHLESKIFKIGVISFFFHRFANTVYAFASSNGVISPVHKPIDAP
jgi:hypothetical protein